MIYLFARYFKIISQRQGSWLFSWSFTRWNRDVRTQKHNSIFSLDLLWFKSTRLYCLSRNGMSCVIILIGLVSAHCFFIKRLRNDRSRRAHQTCLCLWRFLIYCRFSFELCVRACEYFSSDIARFGAYSQSLSHGRLAPRTSPRYVSGILQIAS